MSISTREQLKDHIHSIHDFIRNSGAGYGITALKIFSFFYGLKIIEPLVKRSTLTKCERKPTCDEIEYENENGDKDEDIDKCKVCRISSRCQFSNLRELCDEEDEYVIRDEINDILNLIKEQGKNDRAIDKLKYYIHYDLPYHVRDSIYVKIIDYVDQIPINNNAYNNNSIITQKYNENINLSGKLYEYFIGRDNNAISELGAYFTDRHITKYIINKIGPVLNDDGSVKLMTDPFGGSGGFTLGYVEYMNKLKVDWLKTIDDNGNKNYQRIHHFDMNDDVIKIAGLEFFTLVNKFPERSQYVCQNSFIEGFEKPIYDYIFTNPPYGGDKINRSAEEINNNKLLVYIKSILDDLDTVYDDNQYCNIVNKMNIRGTHKKKISEYTIDNLTTILRKLEKREETDEINDLTELLEKVKAIQNQIININKKNAVLIKKQKDSQVNYLTCSKFIKDYIKNNDITGCNDKEACSLVLLMAALKQGGTCAGVLKEGVFFDNKYSSVRKHLVNNFTIKYIISIPSDQFENTTTKTSIIIFDNVMPNDESITVFYDLDVIKEPKDIYVELPDRTYALSKRKDDIIDVVEKEITRATKKQLCASTIETKKTKGVVEQIEKYYYSLSAKNYDMKLKNIECDDKYEMIKLADLCDYLGKSKRLASFGKEEGRYNFYTSSDKVQKCDINDYKENSIIIGTGGHSCLHYDNNFSCSGDTLLLNSKKIDTRLVYFILRSNWNNFKKNMQGSTIKHVTKELVNNYLIPIPKTPELINQWITKISKPYDIINQKRKELLELEQQVKNEVKRIINEEECDNIKLGNLCDFNTTMIKKNDNIKFINYIDISSVQGGSINNIKFMDKDYPSRAKRIIKKGDILYSSVRPNLKGYTLFNLEGDNYVCSTGFIVIRSVKINPYYVYTYITQQKITDILVKRATGSTYPSIKSADIESLDIPVPKDITLIKDLEPNINILNKLQDEIIETEKEYKKLLGELYEDTLKKIDNINNNTVIPETDQQNKKIKDDSDNISSPEERVKKTKIIKKDKVIPVKKVTKK
jgi:restriction endonuclease S subunit